MAVGDFVYTIGPDSTLLARINLCGKALYRRGTIVASKNTRSRLMLAALDHMKIVPDNIAGPDNVVGHHASSYVWEARRREMQRCDGLRVKNIAPEPPCIALRAPKAPVPTTFFLPRLAAVTAKAFAKS